MANNYQQFSEMFEFKSKKQADLFCSLAALTSELDLMGDIREIEDVHEDLELFRSLDKNTQDELCSLSINGGSFQYDREADKSVWVYADEYGNIEVIGLVLSTVLKMTNDRNSIFTLTWSETCSKPRLGEFGGGYMVVNFNTVEFANAHGLASEFTRKLKNIKRN